MSQGKCYQVTLGARATAYAPRWRGCKIRSGDGGAPYGYAGRVRNLLGILTHVALLGCTARHAESPSRVEALDGGPTALDAALSAAVADAAVDTRSDAAIEVPCAPLVWAKEACLTQRARPEPMSPGDLAKWFSDHGAREPSEGFPLLCLERSVGPSSEAALFCERMTQPFEKVGGTDVFRVLLSDIILTVRKERAVTLFDRAYYVEVLDKEILERGPLFALDVDLNETGQEVVVRELAPHACAAAAASLREDETTAAREPDKVSRTVELAWARFDQKMLARVCANVGRYTWSGGAFVKTAERWQ
jgi:hypothetical protein